jgi:hypothetical protein
MRDVDPVEEACARVRRLMDASAPRHEILGCLIAAAEIVAGNRAVSSILVLDDNGLLRNGASPNLPRDYLDAIDRLKPDPMVGTCSAAAATGSDQVDQGRSGDRHLRHLLP